MQENRISPTKLTHHALKIMSVERKLGGLVSLSGLFFAELIQLRIAIFRILKTYKTIFGENVSLEFRICNIIDFLY